MAILSSRAPILIFAATHAGALIIAAVLAVFASGCYAPDIADCVVACSTDDDCSGDQSCADGLCTGGAACTGAAPDDGAGACMIILRIEVIGEGKVVIPGIGECNKSGPVGPECMFEVPTGDLALSAVVNRPDKPFERWTSLKCGGQNAECTDVFLVDAMVSAKFR